MQLRLYDLKMVCLLRRCNHEFIKNSLANLKGHKLRVFVALLWIIIGITSVILVSSIGNGFQKEIKKSVNNVNPNKTTISFESADNTGLLMI